MKYEYFFNDQKLDDESLDGLSRESLIDLIKHMAVESVSWKNKYLEYLKISKVDFFKTGE